MITPSEFLDAEPILIVASFERGRGSGHLLRSCRLAGDLRANGRDARLFLPTVNSDHKNSRTYNEAKTVIGQTGININNLVFVQNKNEVAGILWGLIILDRFATPKNEFLFFSNLKNNPLVLGIDEGGKLRDRFTFLVDLLPSPVAKKIPPNSFHVKFNIAEQIYKKNTLAPNAPFRILVTFGGEDKKGLTKAALQEFFYIYKKFLKAGKKFADVCNVTIIDTCASIDYRFAPQNDGITLIKPVQNLSGQLYKYDLVITHIGLTTFEALCANTSVLIVSPTLYHRKAARTAGLFSKGIGKSGAKNAARFLFTKDMQLHKQHIDFISNSSKNVQELYNLSNGSNDREKKYASFINSIMTVQKNTCLVCGSIKIKYVAVIARFADRTYRRCPCCGTIVMNRLFPCDIQYTEKYFFENYKNQYGKTYLEDFPYLIVIAKKRLLNIKQCLKRIQNKKLLLDIGCAYGAFLFAAREEGFIPHGIDVSKEAVKYVNEILHIEAQRIDFSKSDFLKHKYDVITMMFVIEHLSDAGTALKKIAAMLNEGGVLAFSTPSAAGISAKKSMIKFLENSPQDHLTIWNPFTVKKILKPFGFNVEKIVITGHHPERFFPSIKFLQKKKGLLYNIFFYVSKIFSLGDTFEVYAKKAAN